MTRRIFYSFLLIFILSLNLGLIFLNNNIQSQYVSTQSPNNSLNATGINVVNSGNLNIPAEDPTNHTVSWTLADIRSYDYLGAYSFTDDPNGADPMGWTTIEDHALTTTQVIEDLDGHHKVVELYDNYGTGDTSITQTAVNQVTGTVEFWFYGIDAASGYNYIDVKGWEGVDVGPYLVFNLTSLYIEYCNETSEVDITSFNESEWVHIRFQFNCTSDSFKIWVNGVYHGECVFNRNITQVVNLMITSGTASSGGHYGYLDAIDFSWAPGYYPNRNMDIGSVDYLGAYSFTEDVNGADPMGWTTIEDHALTTTQVIEELEGHHKVVEMYDDYGTGDTMILDNFGSQSNGTVEFWFYGVDAPTGLNYLDIGIAQGVISAINTAVYLSFNLDSLELLYYNGTAFNLITTFNQQEWIHLRILFNCVNNSFHCWTNSLYQGEFIFSNNKTNLDTFGISSGTAGSGGYYGYFDAIDYSWAPGYYPNRNMDIGSVDYSGVYSFTDDPNGAVPSGWGAIEDHVQTTVQVIEELNEHHKVVEMYDNYSAAVGMVRLYNDLVPQTAGTIEWWSYGIDGSGTNNLFNFYLKKGGQSAGTMVVSLQFDLHNGTARFYNGTWNDISSFNTNQWIHNRLQFDCSTDTFQFWLDGDYKGNFTFLNAVTDIDTLTTDTGNVASGGHYVYFDAFDYSWASGYYLNRNMDFSSDSASLVYAVYENDARMTNWQSWDDTVQVEYNVSGAGLGVGVHNISLVYNDRDGNWYHDDVIVNVSAITQLTIISDPVDFDISGNRKCDVSIKLNNSGSTTLTNINVTIEVPAGWSADLQMRTLSQLAPGEVVTITYKLTAPETYEAEEVAIMTINITAEILGTGQIWSDSLTFYVIGIDPGLPIWIWIIIVIGSAAAATTSFVFVRRRRIESGAPKYKHTVKTFGDLKQKLSMEFPGAYRIISVEIMDRINQKSGLTDAEKELLLQDITQLSEKDAEKWIDEFEKSLI